MRIALVVLLCAAASCTAAQLQPPRSEGERLYRAKCTSCHRLYEPREQTPEQWVKTIDKMEALRKVTLSADERTQILEYLSAPTPATPGVPLR